MRVNGFSGGGTFGRFERGGIKPLLSEETEGTWPVGGFNGASGRLTTRVASAILINGHGEFAEKIGSRKDLRLKDRAIFDPLVHFVLRTRHKSFIELDDSPGQRGEHNAKQQFLVPFGFHGELP